MAIRAERFGYSTEEAASGIASSLPYLPLKLAHKNQVIEVLGLLDTGAMVNVIPYHIGIKLGARWDAQTTPVKLTGNLAQQEARVLIITATVNNFSPVRLAFAWTKSDEVPLILGQVNFFMEFDVCFYRSQSAFEIKPKQA